MHKNAHFALFCFFWDQDPPHIFPHSSQFFFSLSNLSLFCRYFSQKSWQKLKKTWRNSAILRIIRIYRQKTPKLADARPILATITENVSKNGPKPLVIVIWRHLRAHRVLMVKALMLKNISHLLYSLLLNKLIFTFSPFSLLLATYLFLLLFIYLKFPIYNMNYIYCSLRLSCIPVG